MAIDLQGGLSTPWPPPRYPCMLRPMTVEIYLCKAGQALKEGRMMTADGIDSKADAEADAVAQIKRDPSLAKIAYYKISANGDFKLFFTYTNPKAGKAGAPKPKGAAGERPRGAPVRKPAPMGLWAKVKMLFGA